MDDMAPFLTLKRKLNREDLWVIASNLVPVFGVAFLGWSAAEAFIVYALETLIIGVFTLIELVLSLAYQRREAETRGLGIVLIPFFILHFGIFSAVQTAIFTGTAGITPAGKGALHFFFNWWTYINTDSAWMLAAFAVSHAFRELVPFVNRGWYRTLSPLLIMFRPYGRVLIQQVTVIIGSMFLAFKLGVGFIIIFAGAKILMEVFFNLNVVVESILQRYRKGSGEQ